MKGNNQYVYKQSTSKLIMGMFALGSLIAISGCNSGLTNSQPPQEVDNKPLASQTENASPTKTESKHITSDDSASTADGIEKVINANNQLAVDMYQQISELLITSPASVKKGWLRTVIALKIVLI